MLKMDNLLPEFLYSF